MLQHRPFDGLLLRQSVLDQILDELNDGGLFVETLPLGALFAGCRLYRFDHEFDLVFAQRGPAPKEPPYVVDQRIRIARPRRFQG